MENMEKIIYEIQSIKSAMSKLEEHFNLSCDRRAGEHKDSMKDYFKAFTLFKSETSIDIVKLHERIDILRTQAFSALFILLVLGIGAVAYLLGVNTATAALLTANIEKKDDRILRALELHSATINETLMAVTANGKDIQHSNKELTEIKAQIKSKHP